MSKIEDSKTQGETIRIECPECNVRTKHTVERALEWSDSCEEAGIYVSATYQIVRCNGCDTVSFRSVHGSSEDYQYTETGEEVYLETEKLYPERAKRSLTDELYLRNNVYDVPLIIQAVYRETLSAVQHDLPTLAGVGIRAVIEATCADLKAKKRNLADKIDELVSLSLLTPAGAEVLHGIRLLGNDAAHEMKAPSTKQISAALKVIDHLLLGVYVLPLEASVLPKHEPQSGKSAAKQKAKGEQKPHRGN
jgi:hypothetical protein